MKNRQENKNEIHSEKREIFLKTGAIICIIISVTSAILITQILPRSHSMIAMILNTIVGTLAFLSFFLQLRQKDPDKQNSTDQ